MAKTVKCAFCGKELNAGFFTSEVCSITTSDLERIDCCQECHDTYRLTDDKEIRRFTAKLNNYRKNTGRKKLAQSEMAQLYRTYVTQRAAYQAQYGNVQMPAAAGMFRGDEGGFFCVQEADTGKTLLNGDIYKINKKQDGKDVCVFRGSDISRLEYRGADRIVDAGNFLTSLYVFEVRLNDPAEMTYKPGVTYMVLPGVAFLPHKRTKKAEKTLIAALLTLKKITGTDAEIRKIK